VAIVPERQKFAAELKTLTNSPFLLLTDMDNGYALSLNLAIWVGPDLERLLFVLRTGLAGLSRQ